MHTLWFMDVDGVIAPFSKGGAFRDWARSPHDTYDLWLSPEQASLIRDILTRTGTDLIWVTTWGGDVAEYVEGFLGWPAHPFARPPTPDVGGGDRGPSGRWWKLDAVEEFLDELQPDRFVWSDDDHPGHRTDVGQAMATFGERALIQAPKPTVGLSRRWLREADQHLSAQGP